MLALSRGMFAVSVAALQGLAARPVDVAIIGGGPCGLATALALSKSRCLKGRASHAHRTHTDEWTALALCVRMAARAHGTACALHAHCMLTAGRVEVFESDAFGPKGASIQISKYGWEAAVQPYR